MEQYLQNLISTKNVANLQDALYDVRGRNSRGGSQSEDALFLTDLIRKNATDFTKDIAEKYFTNEWYPSMKQAWCMAFQLTNNSVKYAAIIDQFIAEIAQAEVLETL